MKSFCLFREALTAPIFESMYDFNTGCIDNVPDSKFKCIIPSYFINEYTLPVGYGLSLAKEYYIRALNYTQGLVAFNFYNVGVTVLAEDGIWVMLLEDSTIKHYPNNNTNIKGIFNYEKTPIGVYKTIVRQLGIPQDYSILFVDKNGILLTGKGECKTGITTFRPFEDIKSIPGLITVWRNGYDGILYNNSGVLNKFKIGQHYIINGVFTNDIIMEGVE